MPLLSIREYAKRRGVSHTAVNKAAKTGRITLVDGKVDPAAADRQWSERTNAMQQRGKARGADGPASEPREPKTGETLSEAQTRKEIALANLREKEDREKDNELIKRSLVASSVGNLIVTAKTNLRGIGAKIAPDLAAETEASKCQAMVDAEIDEALNRISQWSPPGMSDE